MTVTTVVLIMTVVIPLCLSVCCFFPLQKTTSHMKCINLPVKDIAL